MTALSFRLPALSLALAACACASTVVPQDRIALSQGTIRAAEEMGADQVPQASLYLQYAREQAQEAQMLFKKGEDEHAMSLLKRSEADAQLALAITRAEPVLSESRDADKKMKAYQEANYPR